MVKSVSSLVSPLGAWRPLAPRGAGLTHPTPPTHTPRPVRPAARVAAAASSARAGRVLLPPPRARRPPFPGGAASSFRRGRGERGGEVGIGSPEGGEGARPLGGLRRSRPLGGAGANRCPASGRREPWCGLGLRRLAGESPRAPGTRSGPRAGGARFAVTAAYGGSRGEGPLRQGRGQITTTWGFSENEKGGDVISYYDRLLLVSLYSHKEMWCFISQATSQGTTVP